MNSDDGKDASEDRQPATAPLPISELLARCREPVLHVSVTDMLPRATPTTAAPPPSNKSPPDSNSLQIMSTTESSRATTTAKVADVSTPPPASSTAKSVAVRQPRGPPDDKQRGWKKTLMRKALAEDNTYRPPHRNPNQQARWKGKPPTTTSPSSPPTRQSARQGQQPESRVAKRNPQGQPRAHNLFESLTSSAAYTPPTSPVGGISARPSSPSCQKECHSLGPCGICHHHKAKPQAATPEPREPQLGEVVVHDGHRRVMFDYPEYPTPASFMWDRQVGFTDKQLFHYAFITNLILACLFCGADTHKPWDCPRMPSPTNLGTAQDRELIEAIRQFGHEATKMYRTIRLALLSRAYHPRAIASASRESLQSQIMGFRNQRVLDSAGLWSFVDANSNYCFTEQLRNEANYDLSAETHQARANVTSAAKSYYQKVAKWKPPKTLQPQYDEVKPTPIPTVVPPTKKKQVASQAHKVETSHPKHCPSNNVVDSDHSMPKTKGKALMPRRKRPLPEVQTSQHQSSDSSDSEQAEAARQVEANLRVLRHQAQVVQEQVVDLAGHFAESITITEGQIAITPPAPTLPQAGSSSWMATEGSDFRAIAPPPSSPYSRHPSIFVFGAQSSNGASGPCSPDPFATSTPFWNTVEPFNLRVVSPPPTSEVDDQTGNNSQTQDSLLVNVPPGFASVPAFRLFDDGDNSITIPLGNLTLSSPPSSSAPSPPASPPAPVMAPAPLLMPPPAHQSVSGIFSSLIRREREDNFMRRQYGNERPDTPRPTRE